MAARAEKKGCTGSGPQGGLAPAWSTEVDPTTARQQPNSDPDGQSGFGRCARRRWRGGPGGDDGRGNTLQGMGQWLWRRDLAQHHRGWRTRHQAQGAKQGIAAVGRGGSGHCAVIRQHHLEHARASADHQFSLRVDQGRGDCSAKRQSKPQQGQFGQRGCIAQGLQTGHGAPLWHPGIFLGLLSCG